MGAECWQMTGCEATAYTRFSPRLQPHPGLISMPTAHPACESIPLCLSCLGPSLHPSVYLYLSFRSCPFPRRHLFFFWGFQEKNVSLLCLCSVFLLPPVDAFLSRGFVGSLYKKFQNWKETDAHTLPVSWSFTQMPIKTPYKNHKRIVSLEQKTSNMIVWGWVWPQYFCSPIMVYWTYVYTMCLVEQLVCSMWNMQYLHYIHC